ncbi:Fic family protein [Gordonia rubripertincta]|uniref:Fic family protein n=1 Tax=Gordonia rubripertincta TaxID=36822 RepID=A0ABT4MQN1_GORRU|nr:Fic family protein [Gordonia rubripertincta]MCZ4549308.1 Fic family protein [Gordonia rubripertincta]
MTWRCDKPYNELPPPPAADELETKDVLRAAIGASAALAQLDQAVVSIPNPTVLINSIPLLEAQASSEIENIVTTTDELFRHIGEDTSAADPATRETLRYRTALHRGFRLTNERGLTASTAAAVCSIIKAREMKVRAMPGTRIANPNTNEVIYSPPEGRDLIEGKLSEWEKFVHTDEVNPLVRMAAAHYQFEAIHPFSDGNGRTGRILNVLMLVEAGLLRMPVLYLSRYIIDTKNDYYRLLLAVTATGAWEEWILYVLRGIEKTSRMTLRKIDAIRDLQDDFGQRSRTISKGTAHSEFQSVLFEQPYCRINTVVERCDVSRPTATSWLSSLADAGLLQDLKVGRDRLFINREFLNLLTRVEPLD